MKPISLTAEGPGGSMLEKPEVKPLLQMIRAFLQKNVSSFTNFLPFELFSEDPQLFQQHFPQGLFLDHNFYVRALLRILNQQQIASIGESSSPRVQPG